MPARNLGERKSLQLDSGIGVDQQGYVLKQGADGPDTVAKTTAKTDTPVGVNYTSSMSADDSEVLTGVHIPVIHDGYPLVLVEAGYNYTSGDPVYVSDPANNNSGQNGTATADPDEGATGTNGTKLGNVVPGASKDLSTETGLHLLQIDVTNNLGGSA